MPSVKKNLGWNLLLTVSGYLFPLLTFPYITRVLGADNLGLANYALSVVDYAILFATLGLISIGYRYIPQCNDDVEKRSLVFSRLVSIHIVMSTIVLLIYTVCVFMIPQLYEHIILYLVGVSKIVMNVFLVEWLFKGMQDLQYVTIRSLIIRSIYVIAIFIFVRKPSDYDIYFYITITQTVLNALINWRFSKKYIHFKFSLNGCKEYIFPVFSMGINQILFSFYGTFNVILLGSKCDDASVGYFITATRLYSIILSLLNAYNGAFVPYLNSLLGKGDVLQFKKYVGYSFSIVNFLAIPFAVGGFLLAPEIIRLIAGPGYERAVLPFQIIILQILFAGIAQILENQILLSFKKFKEVLVCTSLSTAVAVIILMVFIPLYGEVASAYAVAIPHLIEVVILYYYARKSIAIKYPISDFLKTLIASVPIIAICIIAKYIVSNYFWILIISFLFSFVYYISVQYYILRNKFLIGQTEQMIKKLRLHNSDSSECN